MQTFEERISSSLDLAKKGENVIVGTLRHTLKKYVMFFVSAPDCNPWPMEVLDAMALSKGADFDKLIQVFTYWENDEEYRIDYVFQDASNQYLK